MTRVTSLSWIHIATIKGFSSCVTHFGLSHISIIRIGGPQSRYSEDWGPTMHTCRPVPTCNFTTLPQNVSSFREIRNTSLLSSFNQGIQYLRNTRHCASELDRAQTSAHDAMEFD